MNRRQFIAGLLASAAVAPAIARAVPAVDTLTMADLMRCKAWLERQTIPPFIPVTVNGVPLGLSAGDLVPGEYYAFPVHPAIVEALRG